MCWSASRGRWRDRARSRKWRQRGRWPESFDRLWQSLRERHGPQAGTREMIELLTLGQTLRPGAAATGD
jgi:hypothetical protein